MSESFSICAASEMVETGVFKFVRHIVDKSFFISEVASEEHDINGKDKRTKSISEKMIDGTINVTELEIYHLRPGNEHFQVILLRRRIVGEQHLLNHV